MFPGMTATIEKICCCFLSAEERAQKENSAQIDNGLKKQKVEMDKELKLLLLGAFVSLFKLIINCVQRQLNIHLRYGSLTWRKQNR